MASFLLFHLFRFLGYKLDIRAPDEKVGICFSKSSDLGRKPVPIFAMKEFCSMRYK